MHDGSGGRLRPIGRASVIIPAGNEAGVIGGLMAARAGARVVTEPRRGDGSACWGGAEVR